MEILAQSSVTDDRRKIENLRSLVEQCRYAPDAEAAICYHGALSLIYEADASLEQAIRHREEEIAKIRRLHELELENPTGGYALRDYEGKDLTERERRLKDLYERRKT